MNYRYYIQNCYTVVVQGLYKPEVVGDRYKKQTQAAQLAMRQTCHGDMSDAKTEDPANAGKIEVEKYNRKRKARDGVCIRIQ